MAIDIIKGEQSNFFRARSEEKVELEEARKDAKRKYEADLEKQRVYNKKIKSGAHKKAMEAYAQSPMDVDPDSDVDVGAASLGMANAAVRAAARARDPIALASKQARERRPDCDSHSGYGLIDGRCGARCCARPVPGAGHCDRCYVPWDGHIDRRCGPRCCACPVSRPRSVTVTMSCNGR